MSIDVGVESAGCVSAILVGCAKLEERWVYVGLLEAAMRAQEAESDLKSWTIADVRER